MLENPLSINLPSLSDFSPQIIESQAGALFCAYPVALALT
jgi:hypothetical protein